MFFVGTDREAAVEQSLKVQAEIERFLETGESDMMCFAWEGANHLERIKRGNEEMLTALVTEVRRRAGRARMSAALRDVNTKELALRKAEPMVRGFFPKTEREQVLRLLDDCIVFLTPDNIESVMRDCDWLSTAWNLANIFLNSLGSEALSESKNGIMGLSEEQTCYVSPAYFTEDHPFADYVVHEMAHVFHNCKRQDAGLKEIRNKEWLIDIDYSSRENFAYACEAYSRILERSRGPSERNSLAGQFKGFGIKDHRVDNERVTEIVRAASRRRNGWKEILEHCRKGRNHYVQTS